MTKQEVDQAAARAREARRRAEGKSHHMQGRKLSTETRARMKAAALRRWDHSRESK